MRANDRALANIESIPEGFNELRKMHHILDSTLGASEERKKEKYGRMQGRWAELGTDDNGGNNRVGMGPIDEWTKMFRKFNEVLGENEADKPLSESSSPTVSDI